jgi:hypothetical protein
MSAVAAWRNHACMDWQPRVAAEAGWHVGWQPAVAADSWSISNFKAARNTLKVGSTWRCHALRAGSHQWAAASFGETSADDERRLLIKFQLLIRGSAATCQDLCNIWFMLVCAARVSESSYGSGCGHACWPMNPPCKQQQQQQIALSSMAIPQCCSSTAGTAWRCHALWASRHEWRLTSSNTCLCWNLCRSGAAPRIAAHIRAISSTSNPCAESSCCTVIGANSKFKGGPPRLLKAQAAATHNQAMKQAHQAYCSRSLRICH